MHMGTEVARKILVAEGKGVILNLNAHKKIVNFLVKVRLVVVVQNWTIHIYAISLDNCKT